MVTLIVSEFGTVSSLQKALEKAQIPYQISMDVYSYGITPPYLIVNGVPLDEARAFKWIKTVKRKQKYMERSVTIHRVASETIGYLWLLLLGAGTIALLSLVLKGLFIILGLEG